MATGAGSIMTIHEDNRDSAAFEALLAVSVRLGSNPLQVQAAGGNTSLKQDGVMWVKASGTWLARAQETDIMVPVDAARMREAIINADPKAKDANAFRLSGGSEELRASIETSVHAVLPWSVVLHTHCVSTIAIAVRSDAKRIVSESLHDLDAVFIPYVKPGWDLANAINDRVTSRTRVIVLGNHGLVACGDTPEEAERLAMTVAERLAPPPPSGQAPDQAFADWLQTMGWQSVATPLTRSMACDPARIDLLRGHSLYPDHIVFLGPGVAIAKAAEPPATAATRARRHDAYPKLVIYPGQGAAIPGDATPATVALAECLAEVVMRIDLDASLSRMTDADEFDILDWDAEKHRQALDKRTQ